ncbi:MAG: hypothetical protein AB7I27_05550 [Bacteriovoracaceae bacterium]
MWPLFWQNRYFNKYLGTVLIGLCFSSYSQSQSTPIATPSQVEYPGILQTFEKLIQIDNEKFNNRNEYLIKNGKTFADLTNINSLDLEPDFLNSVILHSEPGYIKLASTDKCRFYDTILTDLLRSKEGKIKNIFVTYLNKNSNRESAVVSRKDFLNKVVSSECPETQKLISSFQIKSLSQTLSALNFEIPSSKNQCSDTYLNWLNNSKTPYLCQIHEYLKDARLGNGDTKDLEQRRAIAKLLDQKMSLLQKEYISNLCQHLDDEEIFCQEFLNASFWNKIANGFEDKIYAEDICQSTEGDLKQCLIRIRKENDLCHYPSGANKGLVPQLNCEGLSLALNHSSLRSNYRDCPANSDQLGITNLSRIILNFSKEPIKSFEGPCSSISSGEVFSFNQRFDNDESWKLEACYLDKNSEKEICYKTFFGNYNNRPESYANVVTQILKNTMNLDNSVQCKMIDSEKYNPLLLDYKIGCFIIFERNNCFISECKHKIILNQNPISIVKTKNRVALDYFPLNIDTERFSQQYLLTHDFKRNAKSLNNLTSIVSFFKKKKNGIIHGLGCAEDLMPSFIKSRALNQCTPLPFIIDGIISENDKTTFVTRTSADPITAPRLISWGQIYSAVKSYQRLNPLKIWTLYGLD